MFTVTSNWTKDALTPAEIGVRLRDMLRKLEPLDPAMSNWLMGERRWAPLPKTEAGMTRLVERLVSRDDDDQADPSHGYDILVKGSRIPSNYGAPDSINIKVSAGGIWNNYVRIELGEFIPADPAIVTYPVFRGAVEAVAAAWPCPWVFADIWTPDKVPMPPWDGVTPLWEWKPPQGRARRSFQTAWVAYLSAPLAKGLTPPPEIVCEPTPGGGVILSSVLERLDDRNPHHLRRARQLEAILDERIGFQGLGYAQARVEHPPRVGPY
jgi:Immunity protein 52